MNQFKSKFLELSTELLMYMILSLLHYFTLTDRDFSFDDLYVIVGLWLAVIVYRLIFLQLPISWALSYYWAAEASYRAKVLTGLINFTTFIVIIYIISLFSPVVAGFLEPERLFIPVMVLISTTISPILTYLMLSKVNK